ncbi:MAG: 30S ribosomal protein S16 [Rhizobacter sp.]|nr:30S ribosomal protein S16 [Chlorobiales bacterium]
MVKIRLRRIGRKKLPIYQIVAADSRAPRDGKFLEVIGKYEPTKKPHAVALQEDRVAYWLGVGAQPTDTVRSVISGTGLLLKLNLKRKGKSQEEVDAEFAKWQVQREAGAKKRLARKSVRRRTKKEAEAKAKAEKEQPTA